MRQLAIEMARSCADDKCEDLVVLEMKDLSAVTDYFVIATGTSDRQIRTVADHLLKLAKDKGIKAMGVDGYEYAHWILLDFVDVVVHIFAPSYRQLYDLELLWGDAPRVKWQRRATKKKVEREA
ncbi:MAG: ribosome silencing factor [Planctomycetes bacterium]|nr:ribosome silencing factor [Planctomycetota bacterium]